MEWEIMGPMIVAITLIVTVGGVAVLRPIATRLAEVLELFARDRREGIESEVHQMRDLLETMGARLHLIEERQDFTERLLGSGERSPASAAEPQRIAPSEPPAGPGGA